MLMYISTSISCPHSNLTKAKRIDDGIHLFRVSGVTNKRTHARLKIRPNQMGGLIKPSNWKHKPKLMKCNESFEIFTYLIQCEAQRLVYCPSAMAGLEK